MLIRCLYQHLTFARSSFCSNRKSRRNASNSTLIKMCLGEWRNAVQKETCYISIHISRLLMLYVRLHFQIFRFVVALRNFTSGTKSRRVLGAHKKLFKFCVSIIVFLTAARFMCLGISISFSLTLKAVEKQCSSCKLAFKFKLQVCWQCQGAIEIDRVPF